MLHHIKGNNYQNEKTTHRMEKIFASYSSNKGLKSKIYKEIKKTLKEQRIQLINGHMN
jgi:hypothetical protein